MVRLEQELSRPTSRRARRDVSAELPMSFCGSFRPPRRGRVDGATEATRPLSPGADGASPTGEGWIESPGWPGSVDGLGRFPPEPTPPTGLFSGRFVWVFQSGPGERRRRPERASGAMRYILKSIAQGCQALATARCSGSRPTRQQGRIVRPWRRPPWRTVIARAAPKPSRKPPSERPIISRVHAPLCTAPKEFFWRICSPGRRQPCCPSWRRCSLTDLNPLAFAQSPRGPA